MRLYGWKTLRQAAYWLRGRLAHGVLILGYHRIAHAPVDPYVSCVRADHFAEHLEVLHRQTAVISLEKLRQGLQNHALPRRAVVITFDDGYADNLYTARPLLAHYDLPATVFVVTGSLGSEFWWDRLKRLIFSPALLPETLTIRIGGRMINWALHDAKHITINKKLPTARQRLLRSLYAPMLALPCEDRSLLLDQLQCWVESAYPPRPVSTRAMTAAEVQKLADGGLVTIGAHTVSHQPLTTLPTAVQKEQIAGSKATLSELLGRPVNSFSYPHGATSAVTRQLIEESGFQLACTSHNDLARATSKPFDLPRFWIPDWNGEQFGRWLRWWL